MTSSKSALVLAGVLAVLLTGPVREVAAQTPGMDGAFASRFPETGKIDLVDTRTLKVVIDDHSYALDERMRLYGPTGAPASPSALRKGAKVAFKTAPAKNGGKSVITEMVVLSGN